MSKVTGKLVFRAVVVAVLIVVAYNIPGYVDDAILFAGYVIAHGTGVV